MNIEKCALCPRNCGVNESGVDRTNKISRGNRRLKGFCGAGNKVKISWYGLHYGEEPVISGRHGSGTIFFCHCNLKCVFCQNWQVSQERISCDTVSEVELLKIILELQRRGAHNINLVSPTVWAYWLKEIILEAKKKGLKIPIVWNSNGYESVEVLREMGEVGAVDIYLPDYKYASEKLANKYSSAPNYPSIAQRAILEMQRQVGDLQLHKDGTAKKGLIVRHLILPNAMENTKGALRFISSISSKVHLSLMSQYNPLYRAKEFGEINRPISKEEFSTAKKLMDGFGIKYGWMQEFGGSVKCLSPDFNQKNPFC